MRITHILWGFKIGGIETMLVDIVNEQVKSNEVLMIVINNLIDYELCKKIDCRCNIKFLKREVGSKNLIPWIKLNVFLFCYHPDIIHCHLEGFRKMILYPAPTVATIHNTHTSSKEYPYFESLYAISDSVKKYTWKQGFNSITIYNGLHTEKILNKTNISKGNNACRIVCVGRLYFPHKGQDLLLKAANYLNKRGVRNFSIDFIGDGQSFYDMKKYIEDNNLKRHVNLLGVREREYIYSHLQDYDLFVLPSRLEGFGLTVAEAICAKLPVLVSDLEGPMEILDNGKYGLKFKCGDFEDLALKLLAFLENGQDDKIVENAYKYVIENFDIKNTVKRYMAEYKKVIAKG